MIVLDIEATGTEYHLHSIVSIGALDYDDPQKQFYMECRVWDGAHINDDALAVNGFSRAEVVDENKPDERQLIQSFFAWAEGVPEQTLAGQNVSFDRDFTKAAAERAGVQWPFAYRTVDVHSLAYMHMRLRGLNIPRKERHSGLNLDAVLNYVGIPEEPAPHNALTGARSHAEAIARILENRQLLPDFSQHPIPWSPDLRYTEVTYPQ